MIKRNYQNLNRYDGTMYGDHSQNGYEYDWEVPDDVVVGSPGGVSSIHHHYTKGFYGRGNTSSDIYAGQGQRYNSGVYGSLYQSGHTASEALGYYPTGPDPQYWNAGAPPHTSGMMNDSGNMSNVHQQSLGGGISPSGTKENFSSAVYSDLASQGIELIENNDDPKSQNAAAAPGDEKGYKFSSWMIFIIFLFAFISFAFWAATSQAFVRQYIHKGQRVSWKALLIYSVLMTALFIMIAWLAGVPITVFEQF